MQLLPLRLHLLPPHLPPNSHLKQTVQTLRRACPTLDLFWISIRLIIPYPQAISVLFSYHKTDLLLLVFVAQLVVACQVCPSKLLLIGEIQSSSASAAPAAVPASATPTSTTQFALKTNSSDSAKDLPNPGSFLDFYPVNNTLSTSNPGSVQLPQNRPTLTGGSIGGRMSGLSFETTTTNW